MPPTPHRRRPPPGSRKYRAILDSAEAQFGALGFKKANVDAIAADAGVSKPLIYRYFAGKQHLFEVVVDRVVREWCEVVAAEGAREAGSAAESLRGVLGASLDFARSRAVLRGLLARESQLMLHGYSDVLERGTATLRGVLLDVIERGVQSGEVRLDLAPEAMADVLTEVCEAFANRSMAGRADPHLLETVLETVLHGVVDVPRPPDPGIRRSR